MNSTNKVPWTAGPWTQEGFGIWSHVNNENRRVACAEYDHGDGPYKVKTEQEARVNARLIAACPCLAAFIAAIAGSVKCSESESGQAAPEAVDGWIDHARTLLARIEGKE